MKEPKHLKGERTPVPFGDLVEEGMKDDTSEILQFDDRILYLERKVQNLEYRNDDLRDILAGLSVSLVFLCILLVVVTRKAKSKND